MLLLPFSSYFDWRHAILFLVLCRSLLFSTHHGQKLLKISCLLLQSIGGALFLLWLARALCLASAAVGLRRRPLSTKGSETRLSSSSGTWNIHRCTCFMCTITNVSFWFLTLLLPHLLSHLDAHVRAADLWLGGGTSWGLRCWAPFGPGFRRCLCDGGVCQRDVYDWRVCGGEFSGWRWGGWGAFSGFHIDLCDRAKRNIWLILSGE